MYYIFFIKSLMGHRSFVTSEDTYNIYNFYFYLINIWAFLCREYLIRLEQIKYSWCELNIKEILRKRESK